ncbi:translocation/assembly module TamB domain-containing protein [Pseudidiomarina salinarum]|uniref:translocation/assembly module TamB domain-containing protein n=1 Tax=Pseudidiomarina salinarum TaxID=435908 RepID=UPI0005512388|nr:translocation/assembly module TamB domain-containing protein [Pseudidiomarina salinarum]RUO68267.1 translocation/assembly module TamB [Pseudidiomarina salinarum]
MKYIKWLAWIVIGLFIIVPTLAGILLATTSGSRFLINQGISYGAVPVTYERLEGNLLGELTLGGVRYNTEQLDVTIEDVTLRWTPTALLDREINVRSLQASGIEIVQQATAETAPEQPAALPVISLPWLLTVNQLEMNRIDYRRGDQHQQINRVYAQLRWQQTVIAIQSLELDHRQLQLQADGQLDMAENYALSLHADWTLSNFEAPVDVQQLTGSADLGGDLQQLTLTSSFQVNERSGDNSLRAQLNDLLTDPTWEAKLNINGLPARLFSEMLLADQPEDIRQLLGDSLITATLDLDQDQVQLNQFRLHPVSPTAGVVELSGRICNYLMLAESPAQAQFELTANAGNLQLPYQINERPLTINDLNLSVSGHIDDYQLQLRSDVLALDDKPIAVQLAGKGTTTSLDLATLKATHNDFNVTASSEIDWRNALAITVDIEEANTAIPAADGGYPISAEGRIAIADGKVTADGLRLISGDTRLIANGVISNQDTLDIELTIPELSQWVDNPLVAASATLKARVSGNYNEKLAIEIATLDLDTEEFGRWSNQQPARVELDTRNPLGQLTVRNLCLLQGQENPAQICLDAKPQQQLLEIEVAGQRLPLRLLNRLRTEAAAERIVGTLQLSSTTRLVPESMQIHSTTGRLYSENTTFVALDEELSSRLSFWELLWDGNSDLVTVTALAELEDDLGRAYGDFSIRDLATNQSLSGSLDMSLNDLTLLQWVLPDLRYEGATAVGSVAVSGTLKQPQIQGSLELAAEEIGFAQSGLLLTNVKIAAIDRAQNAEQLEITGQARSGDGWITIDGFVEPLNGVLELQVKGEDFRAVQLPSARVDVNPDLRIKVREQQIHVEGSVHIPYARIEQPDLGDQLVERSNDVQVVRNGEPVTLIEDGIYPVHASVRISLGDDILVEAYGFTGNVTGSVRISEQPQKAMTVTGSIKVIDGEYTIYGQSLDIQRGVLIYNGGTLDNPGLDLRVARTSSGVGAADEVTVGAQIGGTLLAPDFRLFSNPALPESEILSYLVLGRGSGSGAPDPNLQLQALLMLSSRGTDAIGGSVQETFGLDEFGLDSTTNPRETSFYIGKYLSPKLYVKYGVGLFEDTNTFFIRYKLTEHLLIESATSSEGQGGDIFYTIER